MISKMGKGQRLAVSQDSLNQLLSERCTMAGNLLATAPAVEDRVQRILGRDWEWGVISRPGDSGLTLQDQEVGEKQRWKPGH